MNLKDKAKKLNEEETEKVNGGDWLLNGIWYRREDWECNGDFLYPRSPQSQDREQVTVREEIENDPRCPYCNKRLDYIHPGAWFWWFECKSCHEFFVKSNQTYVWYKYKKGRVEVEYK